MSRTSPGFVAAARGDDAWTAKFVNEPQHAVDDMLDGFLRTHVVLVRRSGSPRVVVSARPRSSGVRVISGGGSGHEPPLLGYVGTTRAISGTSSTSDTAPPESRLAKLTAIDDAYRGQGRR